MAVEPYEKLANAIIEQAAVDYRKALRRLQDFPGDTEAESDKNKIERFFTSVWFSILTTVDGKWLMEALAKEVFEKRGNA